MPWFKEHKKSSKAKVSSSWRNRLGFHDKAENTKDELSLESNQAALENGHISTTSQHEPDASPSGTKSDHSESRPTIAPNVTREDSFADTISVAASQTALESSITPFIQSQIDHSKSADDYIDQNHSFLWDRAYNIFQTKDAGKNAELVREYEELLEKQLLSKSAVLESQTSVTSVTKNNDDHCKPGSILNPSQRQAQLDRMLEQGKDKHEAAGRIYVGSHAIYIRDSLSAISNVVDFGKDWIAQAVKASPEASVAWSIVCLGLPLLTRPARAENTNSDGLIYVTSRMRFYIALEEVLLNSPNSALSAYYPAQIKAHSELETRLLELYQLIIDFQIRSIIRYHKGRWYEDIYGKDDWEGMRGKIRDLETNLQQDSLMIANSDSRINLQRLLENADKAQTELLDIQRKQLTSIQHIEKNTIEQANIQHEINTTLQQIKSRGDTQVSFQLQQREADCLQMFRHDVLYESTKARIVRHVEGTCLWFLNQPTYTDWLNNPGQCLLVSADPGCGKSVLARNLVDNELPKYDPKAFISYFFFKQGTQDSLATAVPALLHQFLSKDQGFFKHVMPVFQIEGQKLLKNMDLMLQILYDIMIDSAIHVTTFVVLDALDECEAMDRERLLTWVRSFQRKSDRDDHGPKFLLTVRPYDDILSSYEYDAKSSQLHIPGNEESEAIGQEVNLVIRYRAEELYQKGRIIETVRDELTKMLLADTYHTYLWVYVVFDELARRIGKQTLKEVQKVLKSLPATIEEAYENILNKYTDDEEIQGKVIRILNVMLAATRPLTVQEIQCAVKIELSPYTESHDELDLEEENDFIVKLRNWCGLFIQIHDDEVSFLHQTARDFLQSKEHQVRLTGVAPTRWAGFTNYQQANMVMASICVAYLSLDDFSKPIGLPPVPSRPITLVRKSNDKDLLEDNDIIDNDNKSDDGNSVTEDLWEDYDEIWNKYPLLQYASDYWDTHFEGGNCVDDSVLLQAALSVCDSGKRNYENWLRATNLKFRFLSHVSGVLDVVASMESPSLLKAMLQDYDFSSQPSIGKTALAMAVFGRMKDNSMVLLNHHANGDSHDEDADSLLHFSAAYGWTEVVLKLLDQGLKPDLRNSHDETPLHGACSADHPETAELLLKRGADPSWTSVFGATPLHKATTTKSETIIDLLLKYGAKIDTGNGYGLTALHYAISLGNEKIVTHLLRRGANPNLQSSNGLTPLHRALIEKQGKIAEILCENKASLKINDRHRNTVLHLSITGGTPELTKLFIDKGIGLEIKNKLGWTAMYNAAHHHNLTSLRILLEKGANPNIQTIKLGWSALQKAAKDNDISAVELLLMHGANVGLRSKDGSSALHEAAKMGHIEVVERLLHYEVDINAQVNHGSTALMMAAQYGHELVVRLLLEHGADATIEDADCDTAWSAASQFGHESLLKLLPERLVSKRASLSDLWPCKPFWEQQKNGENSTYNKQERRPFEFSYVLPRKRSLGDLKTVVQDPKFLTILRERQ